MFIEAFHQSAAELRERIAGVRYAGEGIAFFLDGQRYAGSLKGRNADLILTGTQEIDRAIAVRVFIDGCAHPTL